MIGPLTASTGAVGAPPDNLHLARQLAEVRRATAKYHNLDAALAADYVPLGDAPCVENPGVGAIGHHYYNPVFSTRPSRSSWCTPRPGRASGWSRSST